MDDKGKEKKNKRNPNRRRARKARDKMREKTHTIGRAEIARCLTSQMNYS